MSFQTDKAFGRRGGGWAANRSNEPVRICAKCDRPMMAGQKERHFLCDPKSVVGRSCSCPSGCSTKELVGGGPAPCDPSCAICTAYAYASPRSIGR